MTNINYVIVPSKKWRNRCATVRKQCSTFSYSVEKTAILGLKVEMRIMSVRNQKAHDYAKTLFLDTSQKLTIGEIAERVGVRPNTVSNWIKKFGWEKLRKSLLVTRQIMISDLYDQLDFLNTSIKEREIKVANSKEANTIAVLTTSIKRLETETSIAEIYEVATGFLDFLKPIDFELYQKLVPFFDTYIQSKIK